MAQAVHAELRDRVTSVIAWYIHEDVDSIITLVERLHGVYIGFAVLDFANGLPIHEGQNKVPLEIVMDNVAVDELITFFADKNDPDYVITFDTDTQTVWETEVVCTRIVRVHITKVSLQFSVCARVTLNSSIQSGL